MTKPGRKPRAIGPEAFAAGIAKATGAPANIEVRPDGWAKVNVGPLRIEWGPRRRLQTGRPPGVTDIRDDSALRTALRAMDKDTRQVTRATLATEAGFTEAALGGYLRVTGRKMDQLKADLRSSPR